MIPSGQERSFREKLHNMEMLSSRPRVPHSSPGAASPASLGGGTQLIGKLSGPRPLHAPSREHLSSAKSLCAPSLPSLSSALLALPLSLTSSVRREASARALARSRCPGNGAPHFLTSCVLPQAPCCLRPNNVNKSHSNGHCPVLTARPTQKIKAARHSFTEPWRACEVGPTMAVKKQGIER